MRIFFVAHAKGVVIFFEPQTKFSRPTPISIKWQLPKL